MSSTTTRPPRSPGALLADAVADLDEVVARLAALTADGALAEVPAASLTALTESLHRAVDRATAVATVATGAVHATGALEGGGFASTKAWLQGPCRKSETEAKVLLASSAALREQFPATGRAWLGGEVPAGAVREVTRGISLALRSLPAGDRAREGAAVEAVLLTLARTAPVADVARAARFLRLAADPDGARQAALDAYDDQQLTLKKVGAGFQLSAYLTAETAAALSTALDAVVDGWHRDGSLTGDDQPTGSAVLDAQRRRLRRPHLLALALGHLAATALDGGLFGTRHGVRPHVTVTADLDRLAAGLGGQLLIPGHEQPVLLPTESIARILCDADIHPVLTTSPDATKALDAAACDAAESPGRWRAQLLDVLRDRARSVLYLGRTQRTVSAALRRALEVRDGHCAFPGCRVDVSRTHAHHIREWEHGGATDLSNTVLVCLKHHHAVHEGRWTITRTDGVDPHTTGCWTFTPPRIRP